MPPDLALLPTLTGSNYPCLELIFMVPKVFEPLKFDCIFMFLISVFYSPQINILMPALLPQFCTSILEVLPPTKRWVVHIGFSVDPVGVLADFGI